MYAEIYRFAIILPSHRGVSRPGEMKLPEHVIMIIYRGEAFPRVLRTPYVLIGKNSGNSFRPVRVNRAKGGFRYRRWVKSGREWTRVDERWVSVPPSGRGLEGYT